MLNKSPLEQRYVPLMRAATMTRYPRSPDHKNEVRMLGTTRGVRHASRVASGVLHQETGQRWVK